MTPLPLDAEGEPEDLVLLQTATGGDRASGVDRFAIFLNTDDLAVHVDHERRAVGEKALFAEHSILLRDHALPIGKHRKRRA